METFGRNRSNFSSNGGYEGASSLDGLSDVLIAAPATGHMLFYVEDQWRNLPITNIEFYGTSAVTSVITVNIVTAGTWEVVGEFLAGSSKNLTVSVSDITVSCSLTDEIARILYHASLNGLGVDQVFEHCVFLNGVPLSGLMSRSISGVGGVSVLGMTNLNEGDVLKVMVRNTTGTDDIEFHFAGFSVT